MSGEPEENLDIEPNLLSPEEKEFQQLTRIKPKTKEERDEKIKEIRKTREKINKTIEDMEAIVNKTPKTKKNEDEDEDEDENVNTIIDELEGHFADFMENQDLRTKKSKEYQKLFNIASNNIKHANSEKERDEYFQKFLDKLKAEGKKPVEESIEKEASTSSVSEEPIKKEASTSLATEEQEKPKKLNSEQIGALSYTSDGKNEEVRKKLAEKIETFDKLTQTEQDKLIKRANKAIQKYPNPEPREIQNGKFVKIQSDLHQKGPARADFLQVVANQAKEPPKPPPKPNEPPKPKPKKIKLKLDEKNEKEVIEKGGLPEIVFPSTSIILSKKFSGKSNLILNIVEPIKHKFDNIYVISMTHHLGRLSSLCSDEDCQLDGLSEDAIKELLKDHKENPQQTLLIFDDVVGKIKFNSPEMVKLATAGRNFGISVIISIQDLAIQATKWKRNAEYWFLSSMTYSNILSVAVELGIPSFPKSKIIEELSNIARDKQHDWLFYDDRKSEFKKIYGRNLKVYF